MLELATRTLSGILVFEGLAEMEREEIERRCQWRQYRAEQQIIDRESGTTDVYFVIEGEVRVVNYALSGREIQIAAIPAGDLFGELAAIDGLPRSATVTATRDTLIAVLPAISFRSVLERHSRVAVQFIERLARIIRTCDERIMDLSTLSAFQRVYSELLRMAKPDPVDSGRWIVHPYPPEREIASRASTTRETVARAVGQLRETGLVKRKERNLYILDRERIERIIASYKVAGRT